MLDSKAVAAVIPWETNRFALAIRQDYEANLGIYSFTVFRKSFASEAQAMIYFKTNWPQGIIVDFADITRGDPT